MALEKQEAGAPRDNEALERENQKLKLELETLRMEKAHVEEEIAMVVNMRYHLMPDQYPMFPDLPEVDIYADQIGLAQVGGDFFDYFRIDADHIGIVIADIFDGGNAAALYMAIFKLYLAGELSMGFSVSEIIGVVNNRLARSNEDNLSLSAWYGVYEISTGKITAVNAGHESPLIRNKDGIAKPVNEVMSYPLAVIEGIRYTSYEFTLEPGDQMLLYTDGAVEAVNSSGEPFSEELMKRVLLDCKEENADGIVGALQEAFFSHVGEEPLKDDASFLCLQRKKA